MKHDKPLGFFASFILKTTNACNFDCDFCYYRNKEDRTYVDRPTYMDLSIIDLFAKRLKEYLETHETPKIQIIFHGGEPTLLPIDFYNDAITRIRNAVGHLDRYSFGLQTNGSKLTPEWIDCLHKNDMCVSISLDGDRAAQDRHKLYTNKRSSFDDVVNSLHLLQSSKRHGRIFGGLLAVVDLDNDPKNVYEFHKQFKKFDYLLPSADHDHKPERLLSCDTDTSYSDWLKTIFDLWIRDNDSSIKIRYFEEIIKELLGGYSGIEGVGTGKYPSVLTIHTDGEIQDNDNLNTNFANAARFGEKPLYLSDIGFCELQNTIAYQKVLKKHAEDSIHDSCKQCKWRTVCGGANLTSRYSSENQYDNVSVYCSNLFDFISHVDDTITKLVKK